jgi:hypothetical protein
LCKLALLVSGVGRYRGSIAELMPLATGPMFIVRLAVVFLLAISGFGINHPTSAAINRLWAWI